jgi:hypothetical protein
LTNFRDHWLLGVFDMATLAPHATGVAGVPITQQVDALFAAVRHNCVRVMSEAAHDDGVVLMVESQRNDSSTPGCAMRWELPLRTIAAVRHDVQRQLELTGMIVRYLAQSHTAALERLEVERRKHAVLLDDLQRTAATSGPNGVPRSKVSTHGPPKKMHRPDNLLNPQQCSGRKKATGVKIG